MSVGSVVCAAAYECVFVLMGRRLAGSRQGSCGVAWRGLLGLLVLAELSCSVLALMFSLLLVCCCCGRAAAAASVTAAAVAVLHFSTPHRS